MTTSLWIPGPLPGMNEIIEAAKGAGGTGRSYAKLKREWTEAVWLEARTKKIGSFFGPVELVFTWVEKSQKRDKDNVAAGRKFVLDGLVLAGVLSGDGWKQIAGWRDTFDVNPDRPGVGVVISSYSGIVIV